MIKRKSLLSQGCGAHYIQRNKEENDIRLLTGNNTSQKTVKHLKIIEKKKTNLIKIIYVAKIYFKNGSEFRMKMSWN